MSALWSLEQATVHEIRAEIIQRRPLAYTTVMTVMDRLARKGVASRQKRGRSHVYRPAIAEQAIRSRAVEKLVNSFFAGSPQKLLEYLRTPFNGWDSSGNPTMVTEPAVRKPARDSENLAGESIDPSLL